MWLQNYSLHGKPHETYSCFPVFNLFLFFLLTLKRFHPKYFHSLRLGVASPQTEEQLLKLDEQGLSNHYKVGIMYCRAGQGTEEEMYNNEDAGPAFQEFLENIGQRVRLKGFDKYKAGLDNKSKLYPLINQSTIFQTQISKNYSHVACIISCS